jgi:hypothetical protein
MAWRARQVAWAAAACRVRHGHCWPMGFSGPGWAEAGAGRAFGLGPNWEDRICFYFPKLFSIAKTISV